MVPQMVVVWLTTLSVGGALLVAWPWLAPEPSRARRVALGVVGLCAALGLFAYLRFGALHENKAHGPANFHIGESYHYFLGSKWFDATGHFELYTCSMTALVELGSERKTVTGAVRDLRSKLDYIALDDVIDLHGPGCHQRFGDRWPAFKADVAAYLDIYDATNPAVLRQTLFDAGYNSSPVFPALYGTAAWAFPLASTWKLQGFADMLLVAAALAAVGRVVGARAVLGFLLVFFTNPLATYMWTGGSWFRHAWFAALVGALVALRSRWFAIAGALLGYIAVERGFPAVYAVGAAIPMAWAALRSEEARRDLGALAAGFAGAAIPLVALSLALYGPSAWVDFATNARAHGALLWIPHVGLKKVFAFDPAAVTGDYWYEGGTGRFRAHENGVQARLADHLWAYRVAAVLGALAAARAALTDRPDRAALLFGTVALLAFTVPAGYYFILLAAFPVVYALDEPRALDAARLALAFGVVVVLFWTERAATNIILRFDYASMALTGFLVALIALRFAEQAVAGGPKGA